MPDIRAVRVLDPCISKCKDIPPGIFVRGSTNTFVNSRGQIRLLDSSKPGPGKAIEGSRRTFVNSKPAVRVKDKVICGKITNGSYNTFIY